MVTQKRGRGRPSFKPTAAHSRKVEELLACGMSQEDISRVLGITKPTLEKYFPEEIATGAARKRAELYGLMWKGARKGSASAQRRLYDIVSVAAAAESLEARAHPEQERAPVRRGKKEEQQAAAENVVGKYVPPAPPKLVVNNGGS
jgi:predicted transcriptional regulator